ncbi:hypothetical protein BDV37DRAFT_187015 [Aspergillus pseudonomiae]|uniref:Uncharacterized protein n=1 Tax=Aspergillus pseudonomiae TaxID=1506151 RepID=A0A5N7D4P7_9EURO|nr:uncharacterized protein BDV37DRAFT_187015 [Aspergillus pseudonomiae]KAE8401117.1 hypothetical protein BDV37DRAFT_187015 [Aspergillus pseudonomiae]
MEIHRRVRQAVREGNGALRGAALQPTFQVQVNSFCKLLSIPSLSLSFPLSYPAASYPPNTFLSHSTLDYSPFIGFFLLITLSPSILNVFSSFRLSSLFPPCSQI